MTPTFTQAIRPTLAVLVVTGLTILFALWVLALVDCHSAKYHPRGRYLVVEKPVYCQWIGVR